MVNIVLIGGELRNKGAEAMVLTSKEILSKLFPRSKVTLASYYQEDLKFSTKELPIIRNSGLKSKLIMIVKGILYKLFPFSKLRNLLRKDRLFRELTNGSLVVDISGYRLSDKWGRKSLYGNLLYVLDILVSKLLGNYHVIFPQAMGPFYSKLTKILVKFGLLFSDLIMVRDRLTFQYLRNLGISKNKILLCPDIALKMKPIDEKEAAQLLKAHGVNPNEKNIGVIPNVRIYEKLDHSGKVEKNRYFQLLVALIKYILNSLNANVVIIPHEFIKGTKDDRWLALQVMNKIGENERVHIIDREYETRQLKGIISCMDLVVTSRFHGAIAALSTGVPTIVVGWAHKYKELMKDFDEEDYFLDYKEASLKSLIPKISLLWEKKEVEHVKLLEKTVTLRKLIDNKMMHVKKLVYRNWWGRNIEYIALGGICIGCGLCSGVCERNAIKMVKNESGLLVPHLDPGKCNNCGVCVKVCPMVNFRLTLKAFSAQKIKHVKNELDGCEINAGWALTNKVRRLGQSGGMITALLSHWLDKGLINGAVLTKTSKSNPFIPKVFIATSKEEIKEAAGSKYCPVPLGTIHLALFLKN
ncbi:MAG: polysaccharide pyruvyl transferase family protein [Candidatus Odinarchaeia archaeon]